MDSLIRNGRMHADHPADETITFGLWMRTLHKKIGDSPSDGLQDCNMRPYFDANLTVRELLHSGLSLPGDIGHSWATN